jgi:hypothetical protein
MHGIKRDSNAAAAQQQLAHVHNIVNALQIGRHVRNATAAHQTFLQITTLQCVKKNQYSPMQASQLVSRMPPASNPLIDEWVFEVSGRVTAASKCSFPLLPLK